jgi:acetyl coenzyme A synthetase (ADP forming)-like protein
MNSIEAILCPRSVAVVGASRSRESIGGEIFANLVRTPFAGTVYPVHATASEVQGIHAYPSVAALPERVDLAIVAVPAAAAVSVVEQCAAAGVRGLVMITAGFGETGSAGARLEDRMRAIALEHSMRLVGPNCLGVLNTDPSVALHGTFATEWPPCGHVSIASQSGALGTALLDEANDHGLGIRHFVSLGNAIDVTPEDLLEHWEHDDGTRVILLYLESLPRPRRFLEVARRVTAVKPVIVIKAGRTATGARAAGSHTGSLASQDVLVDALLAQAGVTRVSTLEELFDAATLAASGQPPAGRRVAVITNSGGPAVLTADACESRGLTVLPFDKRTREALQCVVPDGTANNPLDLLAGATVGTFDVALPIVLGDPDVDSVIVECVPTTSTDVREVARMLARAREYAVKPIVACLMGKHGVGEAREILHRAGIPAYALPESAAAALQAGVSDAEQRRAAAIDPRLSLAAPTRTMDESREADRTGDRWLTVEEAASLLDSFGLRSLPSRRVEDASEAVSAADALGWPVAVKVVSNAVVHKSDVGGVILNVPTPKALRQAVATLQQRMDAAGHGRDLDGYLVQAMAPAGIEMFVGATRDPVFGPAIAFGTGGIQLELWHDVVVRLAPLGPADATRMIDSVRGRKLVDGFRGAPAGDRAALTDAIVRVSHLMGSDDVLELDINPLVVLPPGQGVIAVDARVRVRARGEVRS